MHQLAKLLSQLHLNPVTLICTVVQKCCFCCQTCDWWWPCHCSVRGHHSPIRNITLTLLGWLATTKWQLSAYHRTLTHKMQPLDVAFMKSFKTYYAQQTKCGYRLIRDIKQHHIIRDVYFTLPMCSTVEKTLCPFHYLDIKVNSFWSTGSFLSDPLSSETMILPWTTKTLSLPFNLTRKGTLICYADWHHSSSRSLKLQPTWRTTSCKCFACLASGSLHQYCTVNLSEKTVGKNCRQTAAKQRSWKEKKEVQTIKFK